MVEIEDLFVYDDSIDKWSEDYLANEAEKDLNEIIARGTEYLTYREVADFLEVSERTVKRYVADGKIAIDHRADNRYKSPLFDSIEVLEFKWERDKGKTSYKSDKEREMLMQEVCNLTRYLDILNEMQD